MTVIVYRNGVLAADKLGTRTGFRSDFVTKVWRRADGVLVGGCGASSLTYAFTQWVLDGEEKFKRPGLRAEDENSAGAIIIRANGAMEEHDFMGWHPVSGEFWAAGTGAEAALGALHMGASAIEAVEVASKICIHCGGGVDSVSLKGELTSTFTRRLVG